MISAAAAQDLAVIPVFGIWGDWNSGVPDYGWVHFSSNPLNQALGGPATAPAELFQDSPTQRAWLGWLSQLIDRWQSSPNIIAWETFSELDLATGANEENATQFAERASDAVRAHDPAGRPVFASTSDLPLIGGQPWLGLWQGRGADLVSLHPYDANLDATVAQRFLAASAASPKPVFIGESGLDAAAPDGTTLTSAPAARAGLQQAVWAELALGCATARALYWEDGYAAYYPQTGLPLVQARNDLETVPARWLDQSDYTGLSPIGAITTPPVFGTLIANQDQVRGFIRSNSLMPPDWSAPPLGAVQLSISLTDSTPDGEWSVTFTSPAGEALPLVHASSSKPCSTSRVRPVSRASRSSPSACLGHERWTSLLTRSNLRAGSGSRVQAIAQRAQLRRFCKCPCGSETQNCSSEEASGWPRLRIARKVRDV